MSRPVSPTAPGHALEDLEISLLLEGVYRHAGHDFRGHAPASIRRRVRHCLQTEGLGTVSALQNQVLHDPAALQRLLDAFCVHVTEMFRDPPFYRALREEVLPLLRTYPSLRIWHAGCATGEEVYSVAMLLDEAGLLDRAQIYATDVSAAVLAVARRGQYPEAKLRAFEHNYRLSGGTRAFGAYVRPAGGHGVVAAALRQRVTWAQHNLVTDGSFNEFHLVLCRNVLMYFAPPLQARVQNLLGRSLVRFGVLALGQHEALAPSVHPPQFAPLNPAAKLYRRTA